MPATLETRYPSTIHIARFRWSKAVNSYGSAIRRSVSFTILFGSAAILRPPEPYRDPILTAGQTVSSGFDSIPAACGIEEIPGPNAGRQGRGWEVVVAGAK